MRLSDDQIEHIKNWLSKYEENDDIPTNGLTIEGLLDTIEAQQQEIDKLTTMWDDASNALTAEFAENEQLRAQVARIRKVLKLAKEALKYFAELYGEGLEVINWHQNGDTEPFDNFYDNSGTHEAIAAIEQIGGQEDGA